MKFKRLAIGIILVLVWFLMNIFLNFACRLDDKTCFIINGAIQNVIQPLVLIIGIALIFLNFFKIVKRDQA